MYQSAMERFDEQSVFVAAPLLVKRNFLASFLGKWDSSFLTAMKVDRASCVRSDGFDAGHSILTSEDFLQKSKPLSDYINQAYHLILNQLQERTDKVLMSPLFVRNDDRCLEDLQDRVRSFIVSHSKICDSTSRSSTMRLPYVET